MTDTPPVKRTGQRDPDCSCEIEYPGPRRIWCEHCTTDGPLPGSLADPDAYPEMPR